MRQHKFAIRAVVLCLGAAAMSAALAAPKDEVELIVGHKVNGGGAVRAEVGRGGGRVVEDLSEIDALVVSMPRGAAKALARHAQVDFVDEPVERHILGNRSIRVAGSQAQVAPYGIAMVQADQLSDAQAGNRRVCIVDSGINGTHEDLAGIPMTGQNFTKSGAWNTDENSHGTHVAGTIAALNNAVGVVGVAPSGRLNLHIAKVFDASGSASDAVISRAMLGCGRAGANVISMSLGGATGSRTEARTVAKLASQGILLVAAAGNEGDNTLSYPAAFAEVVSIAAVDANKLVASFSQFNADVELAAPGVAVLSTVPAYSQTGASLTVAGGSFTVQSMDGSPRSSASGSLADFGLGSAATPGSMNGKVCLIQRGTIAFADKVLNCQSSGGVGAVIYNNTTGDLLGTLGETVTTIPSVGATQADGATLLGQLGQSASVAVFGLPDLYASYSGTSMATPHASAVAALVWSLHAGCTATQLRASLNKSALDLGAPGRDDYYGNGLVQAKAAHDRIAALGCGN
ncbi:S8 family serine peptidase [Pelomonas sp. Root1237]|uniref:S8 family serine peptidase n=1 Tax=Pelomonas sp. Root1237 TaxID=1736434 RepID=UPI0006FD5659|nr:S8 family serine peptidase [Pelomonas sp. Root1237]KQV92273.1 peptidase S8 [Pelomonas sp. Root1237]